jgi:hypothetical protein
MLQVIIGKVHYAGQQVYFEWCLGTSAKLSVCAFAHMEERCSHWMDFHEIWLSSIFQKFVEKKVSLIPDKNNGCFAWRPKCIFDHISVSSSQNEKFFRLKLERKSKHTFYVQ